MLKRWLVAAVAAGAAVFGPDQAPASAAPASGCRKVMVIDAASGRPLGGIEDIAVNGVANTAYLSADDRWTVEDQAARRASALPRGGVYALPLDDATLRAERIAVADATIPFKTGHDFHPHGIDVVTEAEGRATLYVINRRFERRNSAVDPSASSGRWITTPTVEVFDVDETGALRHRRTVRDAAFCRANGIIGIDGGRFIVSNDGGACGRWGRRLEQTFGLKRGNVVLVETDDATGAARVGRLVDGIGFANGLARDARHLYVAATRDRAVLVYRFDDSRGARPLVEARRSAIDGGGPDNLSWMTDRVLLMAVHPSLWRLAAYRYRWPMPGADAAPTRIVGVDIRNGGQYTIYASDAGEPLSAATVAVVHRDIMIAGSVTDSGLMLCRLTKPDG